MQTWSEQHPRGPVSAARKFPTTILLFFSLAGLIAGFAFGGLNGSKAHPTTGNTGPVKKPSPVVQTTVTVTPTVQPIVKLNPPDTLNLSTATQKADGSTNYSITIQTIDTNKNAIHAANITCKLWLVQQIPDGKILNIDSTLLKSVNNLISPIPGTVVGTNQPVSEIPSSLNFTTATPQTALCNANGQMTWNYTIAATVPPGKYDLVYLTDWQGVHFNWSWDSITIQ